METFLVALNDDFEHFYNRSSQVASGLGFGVFFLLGLAGLSASDSKAWPAVMVAGGAAMAVRGAMSASAHMNEQVLVLSGFLRTRTFAWRDLARVEVALGSTGMNSGQREFLCITKRDGSRSEFKEFNARPARPGSGPTEVLRASRTATRRIEITPCDGS